MKKIISLICALCMVLACLPTVAFAGNEEIVISNTDARVTHTGTWTNTTNATVSGPNGESSMHTSTKGDSVSYDLTGYTGNYDLYWFGRPYAAPASVATVELGDTTVGTFNPSTVENGTWFPMGTFDLTQVDELKITNTSGALMRDVAVKLVANTSGEAAESKLWRTGDDTVQFMTCNQSVCSTTGVWKESTNVNVIGPTGGTSWYITAENATAKYDLRDVEPGQYDIYFYNVYYAHKSTNVLAEVVSEGNVTSGYFSPAELAADNTNDWVLLGTYTLKGEKEFVQFTNKDTSGSNAFRNAGIMLVRNTDGEAKTPELTNVTVKEYVDDTVNIEEVGREIPANSYILLGSTDEGFSKSEGWKQSSVQYPTGIGYYSSQIGAWAEWKLYLQKAEGITLWYLVPSCSTSEDPALKLEVYAEGEIHTYEVDFTNTAGWVNLGTYDFDGEFEEYVRVVKQEGTEGTASRITNLRVGYASAVSDTTEEELNSVWTGTDKEILQRLGLVTGGEEGITEEWIQGVPTQGDLNRIENLLCGQEVDTLEEDDTPVDAKAYARILLEQMGYEEGSDFTEENLLTVFQTVVDDTISGLDHFTYDVLAEMTVRAFETTMKGEKRSFLGSVMNQMEPIEEPVYTDPDVFTEEMRQLREEAKNRDRTLIYNNDGNDTYVPYANYPGPFDASTVADEEITIENFLSKRMTGLEDSQVDSVFYCTGVNNSYHHKSEIADLRQRDWSPRLITDLGTDSMSIILDWCRENDREFMWSMRMNDVHDRQYGEEYLDSFKQEHLDWLVSRRADSSFNLKLAPGFWSSMDYAQLGVRQRTYDLLREVLLNYDVDGIELDFSRWNVYFKQVVTRAEDANPENVERMNNLVRSLRTLTEQISEEKGEPILIAIHVSDSMEFNKAIGLDVEQWLEEDLVDVVSQRAFGAVQSLEDGLAEYEEYDVPVYTVLDDINRSDDYDWNKEAGLAYEVGYDGIQIYNIFDPESELFDTLGSPETSVYDPEYTEKTRQEGDVSKALDGANRFLTYRIGQDLRFAHDTMEKALDSATFTVEPTGAKTTVTYRSTNEAVATVNETTGEVTVVGVGTTQIVASAEETTTYASAAASYTLVVTPEAGYYVSLEGESEHVIGETACVSIVIDSEEYETYNAVDLNLAYDATILRAPETMEGYTLEAKDGILTIYGYGEDRTCGSKLSIPFTAIGTGTAALELRQAKVDKRANAVTADAPDATILVKETTVQVTGYAVSLPDDFTGATTATPGQSYCFQAKNPHYLYTVEATMGGEPVNVVDKGDGSFAIEAVSGNLVITVTAKTPKTYTVQIQGDATGEATAQYMTDYSFTVEKENGYRYQVQITIDGANFQNVVVHGDIYTIPGENITGDIVITVEKEAIPSTTVTVTFSGNGAEDASGEATAEKNKAYTFSLWKDANATYEIQVTCGQTDVEFVDNGDGTYTIGAEDVTGDLVITITKMMRLTVTEFVKLNDKKSVYLVCVPGSLDAGKVYALDGQAMYWSETHGWCYLVISDQVAEDLISELQGKITVIDGAKEIISHNGDVNGTGVVDINDAQLSYDLYNAKYSDFETVSLRKFLSADVNGDGILDTKDAVAVLYNMSK